MTDVNELKQFAEVHLRRQKIPRYRELLDGIRSDGDGTPGSWVREWCRAAELLERRGRFLDASRHYAMARFPYVNGSARQEAQDRCIHTFDSWRRGGTGIERLDIAVPGGSVGCWASGLSGAGRRPLLLIMGGIVTVKEQWGMALTKARWLGMAGVVAEMPGVGENTLPYSAESWRMISGLLDALSDRANVAQTYAAALSFSGHMALRCAVDDSRIRGIVTVGAPVSEFFTDTAWQRRLPRITSDTLAHMTGAHMTGAGSDAVTGELDSLAITRQQLAALEIPVCYAASSRDEIIPASEVRHLKCHLRQLRLVEYDDVHASPRHVAETQLWSILSLFRMRGVRNPLSAAVNILWQAQRARRRLTGFWSAEAS